MTVDLQKIWWGAQSTRIFSPASCSWATYSPWYLVASLLFFEMTLWIPAWTHQRWPCRRRRRTRVRGLKDSELFNLGGLFRQFAGQLSQGSYRSPRQDLELSALDAWESQIVYSRPLAYNPFSQAPSLLAWNLTACGLFLGCCQHTPPWGFFVGPPPMSFGSTGNLRMGSSMACTERKPF